MYIWIKNTGSSDVQGIERTDIFFGPQNDFYRVNCGGTAAPYWEYQIEGGHSRWGTATTLKVTVHPAQALSEGTYLVKIVLPNGIFDELFYSVE